jgi:hypothetical protein
MKCVKCGAEAFLIRTTQETDYRVLRAYRCASKHDSNTIEVLPSGVSNRDLAAAERAAHTNAAKWQRDQSILQDLSTMPAEHLGKKWGLTGTRIRQIRDTVTRDTIGSAQPRRPL